MIAHRDRGRTAQHRAGPRPTRAGRTSACPAPARWTGPRPTSPTGWSATTTAAAVLETTLGGIALTPSHAVTVAVTGAECRRDGRADARSATRSRCGCRPGATLRVGAATRGVRSYVAVAGGIAVEPVLGSRSTDTLAHVGPPRAARRGRAAGRATRSAPPRASTSGRPRPFPRPAVLRLRPGPRDDWFDATALTTLTGTSYAVSGDSNRVGLRLEGRGADPESRGRAAQRGARARRGAGAAVRASRWCS